MKSSKPPLRSSGDPFYGLGEIIYQKATLRGCFLLTRLSWWVYNLSMIMKRRITVNNENIGIIKINGEDYISLTDMVKNLEGEMNHIHNWMRNRETVEFLGLWESFRNPDFKGIEFDTFRKQAGLNSFTLTPQKWIKTTNAIGIISKSGRYGGTYAHKDIAFEFGTWISAAFKLYLISEYQRLVDIENNQYNLEWKVSRVLAKTNYTLHTDAVKDQIIPKVPFWRKGITYANEADLINVALFGMTAKEWRESNSDLAKKGKNIRDMASINELIILSNLETHNSQMIRDGLSQEERFNKLVEIARSQRESLHKANPIKSIKRINEETYHLALKDKTKL